MGNTTEKEFKITKKMLEEVAAAESYIIALRAEISEQKQISLSQRNKCKVARLEAEINRLIFQRNKTLEAVSNINNSRIKTAIVMKYFNGASWREIAQKIGMGDTEESIKKAVERFLNSSRGRRRKSKNV